MPSLLNLSKASKHVQSQSNHCCSAASARLGHEAEGCRCQKACKCEPDERGVSLEHPAPAYYIVLQIMLACAIAIGAEVLV
jgi:hypothetical protein